MKSSSNIPDLKSFEVQTGKRNEPFRLTATIRGKNEKWLNRELKHDWYHVFKYIENGSLFSLYEDVYGNIKRKLTDSETRDIL